MKNHKKSLLKFNKVRIANLSILLKIVGGEESQIVVDCETNTNTFSNLCPPPTATCPKKCKQIETEGC